MELDRLLKLSIPEIKVCWKRLEHGALELKVIVKKPQGKRYQLWKIAHGNDKGRNTVIRDVIAR